VDQEHSGPPWTTIKHFPDEELVVEDKESQEVPEEYDKGLFSGKVYWRKLGSKLANRKGRDAGRDFLFLSRSVFTNYEKGMGGNGDEDSGGDYRCLLENRKAPGVG